MLIEFTRKTIQTIALLAHLACDRGIWGPHLIVSPDLCLPEWPILTSPSDCTNECSFELGDGVQKVPPWIPSLKLPRFNKEEEGASARLER